LNKVLFGKFNKSECPYPGRPAFHAGLFSAGEITGRGHRYPKVPAFSGKRLPPENERRNQGSRQTGKGPDFSPFSPHYVPNQKGLPRNKYARWVSFLNPTYMLRNSKGSKSTCKFIQKQRSLASLLSSSSPTVSKIVERSIAIAREVILSPGLSGLIGNGMLIFRLSII